MRKRIISTLMALCMALTLLPVQVLAANYAVGEDAGVLARALAGTAGTELKADNIDAYVANGLDGGVYTLAEDVTISGTLRVTGTVTLDLNGYVLRYADTTANGSVFEIVSGGDLTVIDSRPNVEHKFVSNADGLWVLDEQNGTEIVRGGIITGGTGLTDRNNNGYGGGVYVDGGGRFTMTGGSIVGCKAEGYIAFGGGVFVAKGGQFTMTGGSIVGCTAVADEYGHAYGGGIRNDGEVRGDIGRTTLSGTAEIRDCHAKGGFLLYGGGISDAGTLTINGDVKIIGCTAGGMGSDAMYVNANNDSSVTGGTFYGSIQDLGNKISGLIVTYRINDADYAIQVLQSGNQITLPNPAKPGYTFDGWYKDGAKWEKTTLVTEKLTLTGSLYVPVTDESTLTAALADSSSDVIRLTSDIKLSNELQITNNRKVTLDLNGYVLDLGGKHISVSALSGDPWYHSNQLTIIDSDPTKHHKFTDNDGLWKLDENGDKTVSGGVITGGSDGSSAIIAGSRGTVTMNVGNIVGCSTSGVGGAVSARNGTFIMNGGSIIGCKTDFTGGAVYVLNGKFIMNSGSITNCVVTSPAGDGGAVYISNDSTFTMTGGSIADCTAVNGSALYLKNGTMNAGGGTVGGTVVLERNSTIQGSGSTFSGLIINNDAQTQFSGAHSPLGIVGEEPVGANGYSYHKVAFDTAGGNMSHTTRYFLQGKDISNEIKPDPRTGYTFGGWNKADGTAWDHASDTVTDNITLYAKWTANTYTVTFDSTGGSAVDAQPVAYGEKAKKPAAPQKTGYAFGGWYLGEEAYDFAAAVTGNMTLTAKWTVCDHKGSTAQPTCTTPAICTACGGTLAALGHEWGPWTSGSDNTHTRACKRDGTHTETKDCSGGTATCTAKAVCTVCGGEYGEMAAHSFTAEKAEAQYLKSAATCTEKAIYYKSCAVCGLSSEGTADEATFFSGNVLDHNWGAWTSNEDGTHTRTCTVDGCSAGTQTENCIDANKDHKCDICDYIISECADDNKDHKCDYCGKKLTEHTGGKATCTEKAVCEVCGKAYGEFNANNHSDLKHIDAKAATKDAEGNIEYWYCEGCGKYFSDKDGTKEIKKADIVTAKLKDDSKLPHTGDTSNLALWIALLFISGGAAIGTTIVSRKKKYNK